MTMKQKKEKSKEVKRHNAVIYTRSTSYGKADEADSIEIQKEACLKYAKENKMDVIQVYEEKGHSHDAIKAFLNLLDKEDSPIISFLLVHNFRRITYNTSFAIYLASELERHGIQIRSVGEKLSPTPLQFRMFCLGLLNHDLNNE